jgi:hypothetical protein
MIDFLILLILGGIHVDAAIRLVAPAVRKPPGSDPPENPVSFQSVSNHRIVGNLHTVRWCRPEWPGDKNRQAGRCDLKRSFHGFVL